MKFFQSSLLNLKIVAIHSKYTHKISSLKFAEK